MPGVPSSRGCDACRRQKKKCDQAKPACGRCARLRIECRGAGQQRYKFHNQTIRPPACKRSRTASDQSTTSTSTTSTSTLEASVLAAGFSGRSLSQTTSAVQQEALILYASPANNLQTAVSGRLVSALQVSDPRFDLSVYGSFLHGIPQRVGSSPALDAAASAIAAALPLAMARRSSDAWPMPLSRPTMPMLQQYGKALSALRTSLSDPVAIAAPETLCALYLVVICQGWLRQQDGHFASHGEAIAVILRAMKGRQTLWGDFEQKILSTLCFLVIMESFINPRIQLDEHLWYVPEPHGPPSITDEPLDIKSLRNHNLARMATLLRSPDLYPAELSGAYDSVRIDRAKLANLLATIPVVLSADGRVLRPVSESLCRVHLRWQTAYALLTLVAMRIGAVLSRVPRNATNDMDGTALGPPDLKGDFRIYVNDLATAAEQALQYYPLGSSSMPLCLLAAYTALDFAKDNGSERTRILRLFAEYRPGTDLAKELSTLEQAAEAASCAANSCGSGGPEPLPSKEDMCCIL